MQKHPLIKQFDIPFVGLKQGIHTFKYTLTPAFFEQFDTELNAHINVEIQLDKRTTFFVVQCQLNGTLIFECDRCLDPLELSLQLTENLIIKISPTPPPDSSTESEDVLYISPADDILNISEQIFEYVMINIPLQKKHPNDPNGQSTCNPEMLQKLNELKPPTTNPTNKKSAKHPPLNPSENTPDPRWLKLKNLKL